MNVISDNECLAVKFSRPARTLPLTLLRRHSQSQISAAQIRLPVLRCLPRPVFTSPAQTFRYHAPQIVCIVACLPIMPTTRTCDALVGGGCRFLACRHRPRIQLLPSITLPACRGLPAKGRRITANANSGPKSALKTNSASVETLQRSLDFSPDISSVPPVLELPEWSMKAEEADNQFSIPTQQRGGSHNKIFLPATILYLKQFSRKTLKLLASFRLAFGELAVIAGLCALGTLIEQWQSQEFYVQKYSAGHLAFGVLSGEWVLRLCLDHVYTSPYFLGLVVLLAASLIACTSTRQFPLVKIARRWSFLNSTTAILKLDVSDTLPRAHLHDLGALLTAKRYQVFVQGPSLYGFKGLAGRFAPIGVHAALLLIMGGATLSTMGGYHGSIMVPQGLSFTIEDVMNANGILSRPPFSFNTEVHVNKFSIETYPNGEVSQFHSDLSLFDIKGKEISRKTISVNDPFRFGGFTMYQTDWGISVIQVRVDGAGPFNLVTAPLQTSGDNKLFGTFLPLGDNSLTKAKGISMLARDLQSVVIYDSSGTFVGVRRPGSDRAIVVDGVEIIVDDVIGSTGLDLKLDPGVPAVYAGFGALMLTTVLSYLSHSQVWAFQEGTSLIVGGKRNRRKDEFKEELNNVLDLVPEIINCNQLEDHIPIPVVTCDTDSYLTKESIRNEEELVSSQTN